MYQRILYVSRATEHVSMKDVYDVIRVAHNRNSNAGLTGGLLFLDDHFIQVLEGGPFAITQRYKRIATDPRHQDIQLRLDERIDELMFPSDWMALRSHDDVDPAVLAHHGYVPGLPADQFSGQQILALMADCFIDSGITVSNVGSHR